MTELKPKLEYTVSSVSQQIPVIVVAAGSSTRMQGLNKQFIAIGGIPVIIRTLLAFQFCEAVSDIILVARDSDIIELQLLAEKYGISKLCDIVCGGNTRQESVQNGLNRLSASVTDVIIHDGARPLIDDSIICSVAETLKNHTAVTCAVKVKDTIKKVDKDGKVIKTLVRDNLVAVQTPQGVKVKEYRAAIEKVGDVSAFTDDMSIMEAAGYEVYTVEGSYKNIKITTPDDVIIAEGFLDEVQE